MSYGFAIKTGTGTVVDLISSDNVPGIYLDSFFVTYSAGTSTTTTYPSFIGSQLLVNLLPIFGVATDISVSINNSTKTITVTCGSTSITPLQVNAQVTVLGV